MRNTSVVAAALLATIGCASLKHGTSPDARTVSASLIAKETVDNPTQDTTAKYEFRIRFGSSTYDGMLHVLGDSMTVESEYGNCRSDVLRMRGMPRKFDCTGMQGVEKFALVFDLHSPKGNSYWKGLVVEDRVVGRECVQYSTNAQQRNVCVKWEPKIKAVQVGVGDKILLEPAPR